MNSTIAAIATGTSAAGIGVIRISGEDAFNVADRVFKSVDGTKLTDLSGYSAKYGNVFDEKGEFDNAVALVFKSPKSYTGENVVEISVHGGIFIVEKTLKTVLNNGAVMAAPGEFTKRAFLNGKIDLTEAEGVADIISAAGEEEAKASFNALSGSLYNKITSVINDLSDCSALMAAWVDYPDEEIEELTDDNLIKTLKEISAALKSLLDTYDYGSVMMGGIDTAIVGKPNTGKSSLMNLLSGNEKSIVTKILGTTRDVVENTVRLGSLTLNLADTAGVRESDDPVESIGIKKAYDRIESSALVLGIFDLSRPMSDEDKDLIEKIRNKRAVAIINKSDLDGELDTKTIENSFENTVYISAKTGDGVQELEKVIKKLFSADKYDENAPILANIRQKNACENAYNNICEALSAAEGGMTFDAVNVMIDSALDELLSLTGQKATEEVVNNIFSKFCVGK